MEAKAQGGRRVPILSGRGQAKTACSSRGGSEKEAGPLHFLELFIGTGLDRQTIWGVTVVRHSRHDYEAGKMFESENEALEYIKSLH